MVYKHFTQCSVITCFFDFHTEPTVPGICSVSGDPHYTSFDKNVHHFMGSCTYTITKPCNDTSGIPYFSVDTQNEHRSNNKQVSYVKSVIINVYGSKIILDKGRKVQVRGISQTLYYLDYLYFTI